MVFYCCSGLVKTSDVNVNNYNYSSTYQVWIWGASYFLLLYTVLALQCVLEAKTCRQKWIKAENTSSLGCLLWPSFYCCSSPLKTKALTSSSINDDTGTDIVWTIASLNMAWTLLQASTVTSQCFTWGAKQNLVYQLNNCAIIISIHSGKQVSKFAG